MAEQTEANPYEFQGELGLTKWFEVAAFQGIHPNETIFGCELALIQKDPWLLTAGFINWSTRGDSPQPLLEAGHYAEHHKLTAGGLIVHSRPEAVLGYAYDYDKHWRFQVDYQSGRENFFTLGFTWSLNDEFQINPAIYFSTIIQTTSRDTSFSRTRSICGRPESRLSPRRMDHPI